MTLGKKAAAREARAAERAAKFEQVKSRLLERVPLELRGPVAVAQLPDEARLAIRLGVPPGQLECPPQPMALEDGSRKDMQVTWCVRKRDVVGAWSWGEPRAWTPEEWTLRIKPKFLEWQRLTWKEVEEMSSGEGHFLHHDEDLTNLDQEAQERWVELGLEEFDTPFRFRFGNMRRFWGFVIQGHFFGVWWEREHRIRPTRER